MKELLTSCTPIPFDERGDAAPTTDLTRPYPCGVTLLPMLLHTQLAPSLVVAQNMYKAAVEQNTFGNCATDKASVQRLIFKVIPMHSLSVCVYMCVCVCVCVHVCICVYGQQPPTIVVIMIIMQPHHHLTYI
jgi:hypothetical protein